MLSGCSKLLRRRGVVVNSGERRSAGEFESEGWDMMGCDLTERVGDWITVSTWCLCWPFLQDPQRRTASWTSCLSLRLGVIRCESGPFGAF